MIHDGHICMVGHSRPLSNLVVACALFLLIAPHSVLAQRQDERSVRTAFIYNLTKYVDWPRPNQDLSICVIGRGTIGGEDLKRVLDGKSNGTKTVQVRLQITDTELQHCSIAYFPAFTRDQIHSLDIASGQSVLTVGEDEAFLHEGGMVAFVRSGDSIQVQVNIDAVRAASLAISSRLLDLAVIVHTKRHG